MNQVLEGIVNLARRCVDVLDGEQFKKYVTAARLTHLVRCIVERVSGTVADMSTFKEEENRLALEYIEAINRDSRDSRDSRYSRDGQKGYRQLQHTLMRYWPVRIAVEEKSRNISRRASAHEQLASELQSDGHYALYRDHSLRESIAFDKELNELKEPKYNQPVVSVTS